MKKREIKNYGRSVKDRLLTVSKESDIPYMTILVRYIQERLPDNFYKDTNRVARWKGFLKGIKWQEDIPFETIELVSLYLHISLSSYYLMRLICRYPPRDTR